MATNSWKYRLLKNGLCLGGADMAWACIWPLLSGLLALGVGVDHGERRHVDDAPDADGRLEDVRGLGGTKQNRADRNAAAGGNFQKIVGDVGGIDAGHDQ